MVEVKAGQWWTDRGSVAERHRILVRGLTSGGTRVICEASGDRAYTLDLGYFLKFKEHLPECTSFEWVPEPKTRTVKVHTVAYGLDKLKFVSKVLDTGLDGVKRDWQVLTILKTEEFEVPCE